EVLTHVDRRLSCLSFLTTCPSGLHYMHLIDHARAQVEKTYRRPFIDRLLRSALLRVMTNPKLFRWALIAALPAKPMAPMLDFVGLKRFAAMLHLVSWRVARRPPAAGWFAAVGP